MRLHVLVIEYCAASGYADNRNHWLLCRVVKRLNASGFVLEFLIVDYIGAHVYFNAAFQISDYQLIVAIIF